MRPKKDLNNLSIFAFTTSVDQKGWVFPSEYPYNQGTTLYIAPVGNSKEFHDEYAFKGMRYISVDEKHPETLRLVKVDDESLALLWDGEPLLNYNDKPIIFNKFGKCKRYIGKYQLHNTSKKLVEIRVNGDNDYHCDTIEFLFEKYNLLLLGTVEFEKENGL